jgi:hypothetical protein
MNMNINEIKLENGVAHYADGRTVSSETGLAPETEVQYICYQSRWTGTGYGNSIYRICGTDNALVIRHNDGPRDNLCWDNVEIKEGYFAEQRAYGAACRKASKRYHLPMEVCLAVGPELIAEFANEAAKVTYRREGAIYGTYEDDAPIEPYVLNCTTSHELSCGIGRRKRAVIGLLAECSEELKTKIREMGQRNSERIARFFINMIH